MVFKKNDSVEIKSKHFKKIVFKIHDSMEDESKRFEKIEHTVNHVQCQRCKFDIAEESIPKKEWIVKDDKGKDVTVKEVTIVRGSLDDCQGWLF